MSRNFVFINRDFILVNMDGAPICTSNIEGLQTVVEVITVIFAFEVLCSDFLSPNKQLSTKKGTLIKVEDAVVVPCLGFGVTHGVASQQRKKTEIEDFPKTEGCYYSPIILCV